MIEWSVYESDKDYDNKERRIMSTAGLIWWLLFGKPNYIVTINKMRTD